MSVVFVSISSCEAHLLLGVSGGWQVEGLEHDACSAHSAAGRRFLCISESIACRVRSFQYRFFRSIRTGIQWRIDSLQWFRNNTRRVGFTPEIFRRIFTYLVGYPVFYLTNTNINLHKKDSNYLHFSLDQNHLIKNNVNWIVSSSFF